MYRHADSDKGDRVEASFYEAALAGGGGEIKKKQHSEFQSEFPLPRNT